jgi:hypothetical protein
MAKSKTLGTQLQIGDGAATEVFTTVAQLTNIGGVELITETEDATAHDSAAGYREHLENGLRSYSDVSFEGKWDAAHATQDGSTGVQSKGQTDGPHNFKIIFPDAGATTASFAASMVRVKMGDAPINGVLPISGALKISGQITWS